MPAFYFATCRSGSEASLKREVAARYGEWLTPAFMRPQLITWKAKNPEAELPLEWEPVLAAVAGQSLGMAKSAQEAADVIAKASLTHAALHVYPRLIPEDGTTQETWDRVDRIQAEILAAVPTLQTSARAGHPVLDVIIGDEQEAWFIGSHLHNRSRHPHPGAHARVAIPDEAPSRAWFKMEQALAWAGLDQPNAIAGLNALELGAAPGGAAYALLQRGMSVWGADTGAMDSLVLQHPQYTHLNRAAGELSPEHLPPHLDLLVSDMNLQPEVILRYIEPLVRHYEPRWLILTLKLNDSSVEERLPHFISRIQRFAPTPVRAKQLHANRREIIVVAGE